MRIKTGNRRHKNKHGRMQSPRLVRKLIKRIGIVEYIKIQMREKYDLIIRTYFNSASRLWRLIEK